MTVPYLMNCAHRQDGWCIDCVAKLGNEIWEALKDAERYQTARCMNVRQWQDARLLNTRTGKPFDEIIDDLRPFMRAAREP